MTTKLTDPSGRTMEFTRGADGDVHVLSRHSAGHVVLVGPLNPAEVRRALDAECPSEVEVEDRFATGARDTPDPRYRQEGQMCLRKKDPAWYCTRERDHEGEHVAHNGPLDVCAVWEDEPEAPQPEPAPTTVQGCVDLLVSLCHEPEGDDVPAGMGFVQVWDNGTEYIYSDGRSYSVPVRGPGYRRLLIDPPKPKRPEGAEELDRLFDEWNRMSGADRGDQSFTDWLAENGVRVES